MVPDREQARVAELLQDAVGGGRSAAAALDLVRSRPAVLLCLNDEPVAAATGREAGRNFVLEAIAVKATLRGSGLGRRLLDEISYIGAHQWVEAETDIDGVEFYRRCGFSITTLGEKYPGVERFRCRRPTSHLDSASGDTA